MIVTMLALMELCVRTRNKPEPCLISTIDTRPNQRRKRPLTSGKLDEDNSGEDTPIFSVSSQSNQFLQTPRQASNLTSMTDQQLDDVDDDESAADRSEMCSDGKNDSYHYTQPGTSNACPSELISPIESSGCDDVITAMSQSGSSQSSHESYITATTQVSQNHQSRQGNSRHLLNMISVGISSKCSR